MTLIRSEDVIELHAGWLDTAAGSVELAAAEEVPAPAASRRLHLVQFAGPVKPEWHAALRQAGLRVVTHVPRNAYLVYGDAGAIRKLEDAASEAVHVQWQGSFRAAHKLHPHARVEHEQAARGQLAQDLFSVQLVHDPEANAETLRWLEQAKAKVEKAENP